MAKRENIMNIKKVTIPGLLFLSLFLLLPVRVFSGLASGTKITTPRGPEFVENLIIGSKIIGYNAADDSYPEVTVKNIEPEIVESIYIITTDQGIICASGDQLFYEAIRDDYIKTAELKTGDVFKTKDHGNCLCINVENKKIATKIHKITLEEPHLFFSTEAQILTHNFPAVAIPIWISANMLAGIAGYYLTLLCLYNQKPTGILSNFDQINQKIYRELSQHQERHFNNNKNPFYHPENYKNPAPQFSTQPSNGGVKLNDSLYKDLVLYPLRYGMFYPIAFMTSTGKVACIIYAPKHLYLDPNGRDRRWEMTEFGRELVSRNHPFVKDFVQAEDKIQLDALRATVKAWSPEIIAQLNASENTEKKELTARLERLCRSSFSLKTTTTNSGNHHPSTPVFRRGERDPKSFLNFTDKIIYGWRFTGHSIRRMVERGISPSAAINAISIGKKVQDAEIMNRWNYHDVTNRIMVVVDEVDKTIVSIISLGSK